MSGKQHYLNENDPRLEGSLLDVIPRQFEWIQPLDIGIVTDYYKIFNQYLSIELWGYVKTKSQAWTSTSTRAFRHYTYTIRLIRTLLKSLKNRKPFALTKCHWISQQKRSYSYINYFSGNQLTSVLTMPRQGTPS